MNPVVRWDSRKDWEMVMVQDRYTGVVYWRSPVPVRVGTVIRPAILHREKRQEEYPLYCRVLRSVRAQEVLEMASLRGQQSVVPKHWYQIHAD